MKQLDITTARKVGFGDLAVGDWFWLEGRAHPDEYGCAHTVRDLEQVTAIDKRYDNWASVTTHNGSLGVIHRGDMIYRRA